MPGFDEKGKGAPGQRTLVNTPVLDAKERAQEAAAERAEIENALDAAEDVARHGRTERRCLVCGGELVVETRGASYVVRCKSEDRELLASRGDLIYVDRRAEISNAEAAAEELARDGHTRRRCLACGGEFVVEERGGGSAYLVRCRTEDRVITSGRGI